MFILQWLERMLCVKSNQASSMHSTISQSWMFQLASITPTIRSQRVASFSDHVSSDQVSNDQVSRHQVSRALITTEIALFHFPVTIFVIFRGMQL